MSKPEIAQRKDQHLQICLEQDVGSGQTTGLERYRLEYDALPDVDLEAVDLSTVMLGRRLAAPLLIGAMTGGSDWGGELNRRMARVATRLGLGMALGSQRAMLRRPQLTPTYAVRHDSPDLPLLFANIGAVQLNYGVTPQQLNDLVHHVQADGLFFHINPLQEAIQPEGNTRFAGLFPRLEETIPQLEVPSLLKEVGAGISLKTAEKLARLPVAGVEASGVGGTSWARVEAYRAPQESLSAMVGQRLRAFGHSTADSIRACRQAFPSRLVIASGGIRSGHDIAVALLLGADAVALARPVIDAASRSEEEAELFLRSLLYELKVLCFCTGAQNLNELRQVRLFPSPPEQT